MISSRLVIVLVVITIVNMFFTLIMPSPRSVKEASLGEVTGIVNDLIEPSKECIYAKKSVNTWIDIAKECAQSLSMREEELRIATNPDIEL